MAKFKVGDTVFVFDDWDSPYDGRGGTVVKVDRYVHVKFRDGKVAQFSEDELTKTTNSVCNAVIEKKLPPRGAGVYIEQQGALFAVGPTDDGWSVANYGGEGVNFAHGFKTASEAKSWCASKGYKVEDIILSNSLRSRNAVVQKALNAQAVCNETIEGVFKGLDSGKYDSVAVAPRDNGFPEVRRYGGGVGFSYGDEDELRAMIKSGKYVELLFYKNHSLKGRIPLNARRVARNFTPQSEFEVGDVVRFRDSVRSVPHDETYTVVKVSGNNVTIKGGRDNSTSVEFKNNLETA